MPERRVHTDHVVDVVSTCLPWRQLRVPTGATLGGGVLFAAAQVLGRMSGLRAEDSDSLWGISSALG